jgi:hypothetical protein
MPPSSLRSICRRRTILAAVTSLEVLNVAAVVALEVQFLDTLVDPALVDRGGFVDEVVQS